MSRGRAVSVSGVVMLGDGSPAAGIDVGLEYDIVGVDFNSGGSIGPASATDAGGRFTLLNVQPGQYVLTAGTGRMIASAASAESIPKRPTVRSRDGWPRSTPSTRSRTTPRSRSERWSRCSCW